MPAAEAASICLLMFILVASSWLLIGRCRPSSPSDWLLLPMGLEAIRGLLGPGPVIGQY